MTVLAAAVVCASAGSAVVTSSAFAGGVDGNGTLTAAVYNRTPYTWTLVAGKSIASGLCATNVGGCLVAPAGTIAPGGASLYSVYPNLNSGCFFSAGVTYGYDAYFTYKVGVVGGPPEFITVGASQAYRNGDCGSSQPSLQVWNTVAPPPDGYDPASLVAPGTQTANPQLAVQLNTPTLFDPTVSAVGTFSFDASTAQGQPFVDLLNSACGGATNASCSFTQSNLTYGPGPLTQAGEFNSCVGGGGSGNGSGSNDSFASVEWDQVRSATLSVGGGVSSSAETSIFGAVTLGASISVDAEKAWEDTGTYARTATIYLPANSVGLISVSPTVGTVTGTFVATIGAATFTATNFSEVRSGVPEPTDPIKKPASAYSVVTTTRPMTSGERNQYCGDEATQSRLAARRALKNMPPAQVVPDRSVDHVALGDSQETVLRRLGWPGVRSFPLRPCKGLKGCNAVRGLHGNFEYKKRKLSVIFGRDRRVAALIYSGRLTTRDGVGKDATMARLRAKFPRIFCAKFAKRVDCSIPRASGARTVFRLTDRHRGPGTSWATDKVLIYVQRAGKVKA